MHSASGQETHAESPGNLMHIRSAIGITAWQEYPPGVV